MIRRFNPLYALLPMTVLLGACTTDSDESVTPVTDPDGGASGFVATYKPDVALMPFPTDAWRNPPGEGDGTLNIVEFESNPLLSHVEQLNLLDGFGLNSPIWADFSDPVDEETLVLGQTVFVFRVAVAGNVVPPTPVATFDVGTAGFQGGRSVLELNPTAPLDPLTTYAVIVTGGVQSSEGVNASADAAFQSMVDAFPAANTASDSATVEAIYDGMVSDLLALAEGANIGADNVVSAWTFTTQSISQSLDAVSAMATAQTSAIVPLLRDPANPGAGVRTAGELLMPSSDLNDDGAPDIGLEANVFAGVIEMPYYLNPEEALTGHWEADADNANCQGAIAAGAIEEAPESTTIHCPVPQLQATISVPVLLTVPNAAMDPTCGTADATGHVPVQGVTIFQHGITQNRTNLLAVAGTLAQACHAGIAIDLPLHGITDPTSPLYGIASNDLYAALEGIVPEITDALTEQTFNLDVDGEEGIDPSGEYFINLESPITARDALRQAAANLIHLTRSIDTIDFNVAFNPAFAGPDFAGAGIRFVGHSLGGITGATYLGVDATADAAVLVAPGGDIGDLILGSASIYPEVEAGLAENGLMAGMRFFDEFFRNAQTLVEAGDPVNYAVAANANHNILMMDVVGGAGNLPDQVVPNSATDRLVSAMGLPTVTTTTIDAAGVDGFVQFVAGDHGSLLNPAASAAATTEMQTQLAVFIGGHPGLGVGPGGNAILISDPSLIAQ